MDDLTIAGISIIGLGLCLLILACFLKESLGGTDMARGIYEVYMVGIGCFLCFLLGLIGLILVIIGQTT